MCIFKRPQFSSKRNTGFVECLSVAFQFGKPDAVTKFGPNSGLFYGHLQKKRPPKWHPTSLLSSLDPERAFENGPLTFISVSEGIKTDTKTPFQRGKARQREALRPTGQNVVNCFFLFTKKEVCDGEENSPQNRSKTALRFKNQLLQN